MTKKKQSKHPAGRKKEEEFITMEIAGSLGNIFSKRKKMPKFIRLFGKKCKVGKEEWFIVSDVEYIMAKDKYVKARRAVDLLCPSGDILKASTPRSTRKKKKK